jgi:hypothetical protein
MRRGILHMLSRTEEEQHQRDCNFEAKGSFNPHRRVFFCLAEISAGNDVHGQRIDTVAAYAFKRELYFLPWKRRPT